MVRLRIYGTILLLLVTSFVSAQSAQGPVSIEELYLNSDITLAALKAQMESPERDMQLLAINTLENQLDQGAFEGENPEVLAALDDLVQQGVIERSRNAERSIHAYDPMVRREAVRVVGKLTGEGAQQVLVRTVRYDPEPVVRAQALLGLARMGVDPTGEVTQTIAKMMLREHVGNFDEGVVYAAVFALGEIAGNEESVVDPASLEMLVNVASDGRYPRVIRELALQTLSTL